MHYLQEKLLKFINSSGGGNFSLRGLGKKVDEEHPQKIKHHLNQLQKSGFIIFEKKKNSFYVAPSKRTPGLVSVPILGDADCGDATCFAEENIEGYLRLSKDLVESQEDIFVVKARGDSMNQADVGGSNIEDGDYVLVDGSNKIPKNGEYILSIIDNTANIKRFYKDKENDQIILVSESTGDFSPIYIKGEENMNYFIAGVIKKVLKNPIV